MSGAGGWQSCLRRLPTVGSMCSSQSSPLSNRYLGGNSCGLVYLMKLPMAEAKKRLESLASLTSAYTWTFLVFFSSPGGTLIGTVCVCGSNVPSSYAKSNSQSHFPAGRRACDGTNGPAQTRAWSFEPGLIRLLNFRMVRPLPGSRSGKSGWKIL